MTGQSEAWHYGQTFHGGHGWSWCTISWLQVVHFQVETAKAANKEKAPVETLRLHPGTRWNTVTRGTGIPWHIMA